MVGRYRFRSVFFGFSRGAALLLAAVSLQAYPQGSGAAPGPSSNLNLVADDDTFAFFAAAAAKGAGEGEGAVDGEGVGEIAFMSADTNEDFSLSLSELLRVVQLYESGAHSCAETPDATEDGFLLGPGAQDCAAHTADYNPEDWSFSLSELLRMIETYNVGFYEACGGSEDGFCVSEGAGHEVVLGDVIIEAESYTPGGTVDVTITIGRSGVSAAPDSDIVALGAGLTLPIGWSLALDADNNCTPVLQQFETSLDNQVPESNARVLFKRDPSLFFDPPTNEVCTPVPYGGNVLEFFWLDAQTNNPLPLTFPVVLKLVLAADVSSTGQQELSLDIKYRAAGGTGELTAADAVTLEADATGNCEIPGDADGNGLLNVDDAQLAFEAFLEYPDALSEVDASCADFCQNYGDGIDPADVQGIFFEFVLSPDPCGF